MGVLKTIIEPNGAGHWISGNYDANQSAEEVNLAATAIALPSGTVLGQVTTGALTATPGAVVSGSGGAPGNGSIGVVTADPGAPLGTYQVVILNPAANAGAFEVRKPDGGIDGNGTVGVAYNGTINFTLADGPTDFSEDDRIPVVVTAAAGSKQRKPWDPTATDGSQFFAGILYEGRPAKAGGTQKAVSVERGPVVANIHLLTFFNSPTTDQKSALINAAKAVGIVIRP